MKAKIILFILVLNLVVCQGLLAQPPLVYNAENTGASCTPPSLLTLSQLPVVQPLPDPFMWANGSGRSTGFGDWECHRNEYKAMIENYEIGTKPPKPDDITATYAPSSATVGILTVVVKRNGQTLTLTCQVALPAVSGPWPAIIGMNSASGSIPASVFTARNIARITFNHNNITTYGNPSINDPFYRLYPEYNLTNTGQYSAWAWGVSRLIDGLEIVQASLPINLQRLGVTGCSYAGKMALYSGALDERIALTIAQESGGGGAPAWRVSHNIEPNGTVEKIDNTDYRWFKDDMSQFSADNVYKLPHDHHQLMAMVAPRALLVTGNTDFTWLSNRANYVTARATKEIYSTLGISDRFGFYIDGGHNHCAVPNSQLPAVQAFVDKFMVGLPDVNTDTVTVHPFGGLDYKRWYQWWGTRVPVLAPLPPEPLGKRLWLEAECATVGAGWNIVTDAEAAGGKYVVVKPGLSSTTAAPTDDAAYVVFPFRTDSAGTYNFQGRLNVPAGEEYSYWMKIDDGAFGNIASQLAANPGFENGLTGWSILNSNGATITANAVAAEARSGNGSMKVVNPTAWPGNQWRVQVSSTAFPTTVGKQYIISYWVRAASPGGSIRLSTGPTNAQYQGDQTIGTAWQQVSWTITASLTSTTFLFDMAQVANTYYIDDVSVEEVSTGSGWQWVKLRDAVLSVGPHTLTIGYNAGGGTKLDKLLVTTSGATISGLGDVAANCGGPVYFSKAMGDLNNLSTWGLNADGSGANPGDFNDSTFQLTNRSSGIYTMTGDWTVGGTINVPTGGQLQIASNTLSVTNMGAAGTITGSAASSLAVIGTTGGGITLNFTPGNNMLNNLTLNRTGSGAALNLGNGVDVYGVLTLTSGTLNTNGFLALKSTAANTARVAPVNAGSIAGAVTVERYIPARRAWRILSAPVGGSQTINQAWQEGTIMGTAGPYNPAPGYGTAISGGPVYGSLANGFDQGAPGTATSIKFYNSIANNWLDQPNTNATAVGANAYMVFVRGDRGLPLLYNTMTPTPTTLRATGPLKVGDQTFAVSGSGFTAIPNPFASPINFATITRNGVQNNFYVWDPKMGSNGAYVLISYNGSSYDVIPASVSPESQYIQSGQGFLVHPSVAGVAGSITIKESDKSATAAQDVFRTNGGGAPSGSFAPVMADPAAGQSIRITLQAANNDQSITVADEVFVSYQRKFSDKVDALDAVKTANLQENLGLVAEGKTLMADRRSGLKEGDMVRLKLWNTTQKAYAFEINPTGLLGLGLSAILEDKFLKTATPVSLATKTQVDFAVTTNPASARTDRFQLRIVKGGLEAVFTKNAVTAFPNPVTGRSLSLWFDNKEAGIYNVSLVNTAGQVVLLKRIQHAGGSALQTLQLDKPLAKGAYRLKVEGRNESSTTSIISNQ